MKNNKFTMQEVRDFWDSVADIYDIANDSVRETHDQRYQEALQYINTLQGLNVLNVWSRTGEMHEYLKCRNLDKYNILVNLEVSSNLIKKSIKRTGNVNYIQTDLNMLPVKDKSFDIVFSLETLEHCPSPTLFINELHRLLKDNGILVLSCPPAFAEIVLWIYEKFAFNHGEGPHRFPSSASVKKLFIESGFEIITHKGTLFLPFQNRFIQKIDKIITPIINCIGLSDLGIRQFYVVRKKRT